MRNVCQKRSLGSQSRSTTMQRRDDSGNALLLVLVAVMLCGCVATASQSPQRSDEAASAENDGRTHHGIDYVELSVTNMAESKRFYEAAFRWEFIDYGPDYAAIRTQDGEVGGLQLEQEVSTGGPLVILYSRDLDVTLGRVRDAGGRITREPFEFPGGRRFHFLDPSGNELAVWSDK